MTFADALVEACINGRKIRLPHWSTVEPKSFVSFNKETSQFVAMGDPSCPYFFSPDITCRTDWEILRD